jgi:hypothetical protein
MMSTSFWITRRELTQLRPRLYGIRGVHSLRQLCLLQRASAVSCAGSSTSAVVVDQPATRMTPSLTKGAAMIIRRAVSAATIAVMGSLAVAAPAAANYPSAVRTAFVHVCVSKGSSLKGCECLFSYVQSGETYKVFLQQARVYQRGGPIATIEIRGAAHCGLT